MTCFFSHEGTTSPRFLTSLLFQSTLSWNISELKEKKKAHDQINLRLYSSKDMLIDISSLRLRPVEPRGHGRSHSVTAALQRAGGNGEAVRLTRSGGHTRASFMGKNSGESVLRSQSRAAYMSSLWGGEEGYTQPEGAQRQCMDRWDRSCDRQPGSRAKEQLCFECLC